MTYYQQGNAPDNVTAGDIWDDENGSIFIKSGNASGTGWVLIGTYEVV